MLDRHFPELTGLFGQFRNPDGIAAAAAVLADWLETRGYRDTARRVMVSAKHPDIEVPLSPDDQKTHAGVRFFLQGGVPGVELPLPRAGNYFTAHPQVLAQAGKLVLNDLRSLPTAGTLAKDCPALANFTGALVLDGQARVRVPWEAVFRLFKGIHSLEFRDCATDHRPGLERHPPESFPNLCKLRLVRCARLTTQGRHLIAAPMFSRITSLEITAGNGGAILPDSLAREDTVPHLKSLRLECEGIEPLQLFRMPSLTQGRLRHLDVRWCNNLDYAGHLLRAFQQNRGTDLHLGVFTPGQDEEWARCLADQLAPKDLRSLGFSSHQISHGIICQLAKAVKRGHVSDLTLEDDTRKSYPILESIHLIHKILGRLQGFTLGTWQKDVAESLMRDGLATLARFRLVGRIPSRDFLEKYFLPVAAGMERVELFARLWPHSPWLDDFLREAFRGTNLEVLQGRYHNPVEGE